MSKLKNNNPPSGYVRLGKLGKTFQLNGGIRFYGLGDAEQELIFELEDIFVEDQGIVKIVNAREVGSNIVIYLASAKTVEDAKLLTNKAIYTKQEDLADSLEFVDIIENLEVFLDSKPFGKVKELIKGNQDILVVDSPLGDLMFPADAPYVAITPKSIQLTDLPPGLLELNQ